MKNFFITLLIILFSSSSLYADFVTWTNQSSATPTVFKVKPTSMKFCESFDISTGACNGANDFTFTKTWSADNGRCDIAAAAQGQVACQFGSTEGMTAGITYYYAWMTVDRTMWLTGSVNDGGSNYCHTDSNNDNTATTAAEGNATQSFTPTNQAIMFQNGPGNDHDRGGIQFISDLPNTQSGYQSGSNPHCYANPSAPGCSWNTVTSLENANAPGYDGTNSGSEHYTMAADYTTPVGGQIWQGGLDSSDTGFILIYKLTVPYTTKAGINPVVTMSFDLTDALDAQWFSHGATSGCSIYVGSPGVSIAVSDY